MWSWSEGGCTRPRAPESASRPYAASDETAVQRVPLPPRTSAAVRVLRPKKVLSGEPAPPVDEGDRVDGDDDREQELRRGVVEGVALREVDRDGSAEDDGADHHPRGGEELEALAELGVGVADEGELLREERRGARRHRRHLSQP